MPRTITAFLAACYAICASLAHADVPPPPKAEPTVVILTGDSQGSGVYIGDGVFVTAAHVVGGDTLPDIELSDGRKLIGHVIFVDHRADLAFLSVDKAVDIDAAKLACRQAMLGEEVMVRGTPVGVRFISTWGRIAGQPRQLADWQTVVPVNISAAPGNSGGPMFDAQGKVLGILVGIGRSSGSTFISLSVPSLSVCKARTYLGVS
jgi:S1-C subfamily serine protease